MKALQGFSLLFLITLCSLCAAFLRKTKYFTNKTSTSAAARHHLFIVSSSTTSPPPVQQPHLTIRPTKSSNVYSPSNRSTSAPSNLLWLLTNRYSEVFHIHLGLILAVTSVQYVTIRRQLKAAINPLGMYLMIHTWECFTACLS